MGAAARQTTVAPDLTEVSEATSEQLAVRAASGDVMARRCFGELVERYHARLFNFLLRRVRSRHDAEDLTQETFVRAWNRIRSYNPTWRFSTWLFTIGSRLAITHHRRSRDPVGGNVVEGLSERAPLERRSRGGIWALAAACLTPEQHEAIWLRYVEELAIAEIAMVMNKSQVAVRVCLFRARQALAERLPAPDHQDVDAAPRVAAALAGGM